MPQGFSCSVLSADGSLRVPAAAALFSLVPITALPALVARTTGGRRLVAVSTSSAIHKAHSSDPAERARGGRAAGRRRAVAPVPGTGDRLDDPEADPDLRSRPRPQCQRHRGRRTAFRNRARGPARQRAPPTDSRRRCGEGHDRRPRRAGRCRRDSRPSWRRDTDLPRHGPPDIRGPGAAARPAVPADRAPAGGLQGVAGDDRRGLQPREPGADKTWT